MGVRWDNSTIPLNYVSTEQKVPQLPVFNTYDAILFAESEELDRMVKHFDHVSRRILKINAYININLVFVRECQSQCNISMSGEDLELLRSLNS